MNVLDLVKPKLKLDRNVFDLSQRHIYSSRAGFDIPVLTIDCVPGDHHQIDVLSLTRSQTVKTDAFTRITQNFECVFVPYQQLWSEWNNFINSSTEHFSNDRLVAYNSQIYNQPTFPSFSSVPYFSLYDLLRCLHNALWVDVEPDLYDDIRLEHFNKARRTVDGSLRLLDMLGYGAFYNVIYERDFDAFDNEIRVLTNEDTVFCSVFRLAAYQKFWFDWHRNTYYDDGDVRSFNFDMLSDLKSSNNTKIPIIPNLPSVRSLANFGIPTWCLLRSCPWKKDKFTSLYPSAQFGVVSSLDIDNISLYQKNPDDNSSPIGSGLDGGLYADQAKLSGLWNSDTSQSEISSTLWSIPSAFDVYKLRFAQLLQRWKEDKLRAGNKTKNLADALYGRRPHYLMDNYSDYIGAFDVNIGIDEVVNTADSDYARLGDIGGKGIGTGNGHFEFDASDFGVLMVVQSIRPVSEYDALMLDKDNTRLEIDDFWQPHFEDMGLEAVLRHELEFSLLDDLEQGFVANQTLGFAPRNLSYKIAVDKVHGEFMTNGIMRYEDESESLVTGVKSIWATPRVDLESSSLTGGTMNKLFFYVDPDVLNNIFFIRDNVPSDLDTAQNSRYQISDQFDHNVNFVVRSTRPMSVTGLPRW